MTGHKPWSTLKHKNDSPERRARIQKMARRLLKLVEKEEGSEEPPSPPPPS